MKSTVEDLDHELDMFLQWRSPGIMYIILFSGTLLNGFLYI